jgi:adenylate cyclase
LLESDNAKRLDLVRKSFYLKVNKKLSKKLRSPPRVYLGTPGRTWKGEPGARLVAPGAGQAGA